jgi:hypothetical protein
MTESPREAGAPDTRPQGTEEQRIKEAFGEACKAEKTCGALLGIDCNAAVDGPYYYVKAGTLEVVARCGGFCMGGGCTNCPPKEWTCK